MEKLAAHPSREELSAYSLGQLPEERAVAIDSHISECEPCCETIVELSSEDTFAGLLQEAGRLPADQTADHDSVTSKSSCAPDDIPPPLTEHPRYEILGLIGKGGMGDVYKARHRKMERTVALKVINRGLVRKAEAIDRFHREVKAAAQLSHSNIVTAYDADHAGDFHFMVMEYVDGVDLSQTVKDRGALPVAEACDYIRQAAIGLQHAHERGMVHRDIKPHNLMVTADGIIKILDFGLASLAPEAIPASDAMAARSDLTAAGAIMGTPDFISPEQANDARQVDIRSDIYSLGATLYYLLSGRVPFDDGSVMHKLRSHAQVEPARLNSLRDDVPEELVAIASKMMAKDPDERYLTPKEVADALESFLRTWRPSEVGLQGYDPSGGGNNSDSGGQKRGAGDSNPSRLPIVAKWLLYTSLVPIALLILDEFVPLDVLGAETDWFWYCVLTSIALSTIGAIMLGVHQATERERNDHRTNRSTTDRTLLVIVILAVSAVGYFRLTSDGVVHIEVTPQSDSMTLGTHPLTIVDTSGKKPLGGTSGTHQDDAAGITTHSFESANGRYKITLVDKVLTVNGERYTLENPTDAIRIVDDRVEITQVTARPDVVRELPAEGNKPATASTSTSKPALIITSKTVNKGTAGRPSLYDWNFKGRDVGDLKVRLLLAQNGKTEVMQEFDCEELPAEFATRVRLEVRDDATGADHKRRVNAILFVESPVPSRSATVNEDKGLSIEVEAPFSNRIERADLTPIAPGQTELLLALSYWKGDMTHDLSMESMTAATRDGNVTFLFVTLDWTPSGENKTDDSEVDLGLLQDGSKIVPGSNGSESAQRASRVPAESRIAGTETTLKKPDALAFRLVSQIPTEGKTDLQEVRRQLLTRSRTEGGAAPAENVLVSKTRVRLSDDAHTVLVESGAIQQMWDVTTGKLKEFSEWGGSGGQMGFVPDSSLAYFASVGVGLWDSKTHARHGKLMPHADGPAETWKEPFSPALHPDGTLIATRSAANKLRLWHVKSQQPASDEFSYEGSVSQLSFSSDGRWLFSKCQDEWTVRSVAKPESVIGRFPDNVSLTAVYSAESQRLGTLKNSGSDEGVTKCEVTVQSLGQTGSVEVRRVTIDAHSSQHSTWIDGNHLLVCGKRRGTNAPSTLFLISMQAEQPLIQESTLHRDGLVAAVAVAADHRHYLVSTYRSTTCWKLGQEEHVWQAGTSEAGKRHHLHIGDGDWILLHEKGQTTGARPAIVRSLKNGNELWRKEDVIAASANGNAFCVVDAKGIEVWKSHEDSHQQKQENIE